MHFDRAAGKPDLDPGGGVGRLEDPELDRAVHQQVGVAER